MAPAGWSLEALSLLAALTAPLSAPCPPRLAWQELPRFQELIFEDFARFILVENTYEEVVLQTVMKDILQGAWQPLPGGKAAELGGVALPPPGFLLPGK